MAIVQLCQFGFVVGEINTSWGPSKQGSTELGVCRGPQQTSQHSARGVCRKGTAMHVQCASQWCATSAVSGFAVEPFGRRACDVGCSALALVFLPCSRNGGAACEAQRAHLHMCHRPPCLSLPGAAKTSAWTHPHAALITLGSGCGCSCGAVHQEDLC
jgi:hypothetical protein